MLSFSLRVLSGSPLPLYQLSVTKLCCDCIDKKARDFPWTFFLDALKYALYANHEYFLSLFLTILSIITDSLLLPDLIHDQSTIYLIFFIIFHFRS